MPSEPCFTVIIPARYQSTRLPGKPLADIEGRPMLLRVCQQALKSDASSVVVATDDQRIAQAMEDVGQQVVFTATGHQSGTDRLAEAAAKLGLSDEDIVVNVQGDEPFMPPSAIHQVATLLHDHPDAGAATLCTPVQNFRECNDPNVVKVVINKAGYALYFSRSVIPYDREALQTINLYHRHIGLYAYRVGLLKQFTQWPVSALESFEKLEQLRILDNNYKIVVAQAVDIPPPGVDTPADLEAARQWVREQGVD